MQSISHHNNYRDIQLFSRAPVEKHVADFPSLISSKYGGENGDIEEQNNNVPDSFKQVTDNEESFSDNSVEDRLKPGVRDKQTAASLRIFSIEKKLFKRKDLSKKQRRAL